MNTFLRIFVCQFLLATAALGDGLLDEVRTVIDRTVSDIHNDRLGAAWESFSKSSRRSYRVALLNALEARQAAGLPIMPPSTKPTPGRPDQGARPEDGVKRYLKDRGFSSGLQDLKQMPDETFWEIFIAEQKDQDDLARERDAEEEKARIPPYEVEAATERDGTVFIILRIPCLCNHLLYRPLEVRHTWVDPERGADSAKIRIVWTGKRVDGEIVLDLPMEMIAKEAITAGNAKEMAAASKAWARPTNK